MEEKKVCVRNIAELPSVLEERNIEGFIGPPKDQYPIVLVLCEDFDGKCDVLTFVSFSDFENQDFIDETRRLISWHDWWVNAEGHGKDVMPSIGLTHLLQCRSRLALNLGQIGRFSARLQREVSRLKMLHKRRTIELKNKYRKEGKTIKESEDLAYLDLWEMAEEIVQARTNHQDAWFVWKSIEETLKAINSEVPVLTKELTGGIDGHQKSKLNI